MNEKGIACFIFYSSFFINTFSFQNCSKYQSSCIQKNSNQTNFSSQTPVSLVIPVQDLAANTNKKPDLRERQFMMNTTAYGFSGSSSNGIDSSLASRKPIEILKNTIQSIADSTKNYKLAYLTLGLGQTEEF